MIHLYVSLIILSVFLYLNIKRKELFCVSTFLISLYVLSLACGILYNQLYDEKLINNDVYIGPIYFVLFTWILYLYPFYAYNEYKRTSLKLPGIRVLNLVSDISIVLSLLTFIVFIPNVGNAFSVESIAMARSDLSQGRESSGSGLLYTISAVISFFFILPLFLSFIYAIIGKSRLRMILLFISSFSYPLYVFNCLGRDGVIFWIFSFFACFLFLKDYLPQKANKRLRRVGFCFIALLLIPFFIISQSRFGEEISMYLLDYTGQSFSNAAYYLGTKMQPFNIGEGWPLFTRLLGMGDVEPQFWEVAGTNSTGFGSLVVSFCVSLGNWGTWILGFISLFIFLVLLGKGKRVDFPCVFVYFMYFQVLSQGLFYFRHANVGGNFYIIMSFVLYFVFKWIFRLQITSPIIIEKQC